jgi:hypothetical protein
MWKDKNKPPRPFKFNPIWFEDEEFVNIVKDEWSHFSPSVHELAMFQFVENLKIVKEVTLSLAKQKCWYLEENLDVMEANII